MSTKQTTIRLDTQTLDRIAAVQEAATVPVSRSAVAQEAIRRGLVELERETNPTGFGDALVASFNKEAPHGSGRC